MGEQKRRRANREQRSSLIIPTEAERVEHGGRLSPEALAEVDVAVDSIAAEAQLPPAEDVNDEIDSMVQVVGSAIEEDMRKRQVRTVSVLAALFRISSNIAKTYLTQCAKQQILEQGVEDVVKLSEIQDNDLSAYISSLRSSMGASEKPN